MLLTQKLSTLFSAILLMGMTFRCSPLVSSQGHASDPINASAYEIVQNPDEDLDSQDNIYPPTEAYDPEKGSEQSNPNYELIRNAEYQGIYDYPVQLTDGRYEGEPFVPGSASRPTVRLWKEPVAFGDLDGDNLDDAVAILLEDSGGSGTFRYLVAISFEDNTAKNVATTSVGDRIKIHSITIQDNLITISATIHGPNDAMCCPTLDTTLTYRLQDGQLIEQSQT